MPTTKLRLRPTAFRSRCRLKFFKMAVGAAILDIGMQRFSNSESPCCPNDSYQVSAWEAILDVKTISAILNLYVAPMPPIKFWLKPTYTLEGNCVEKFQDGHRGSHLKYRNGTILVILNFHVATKHPTQFQLNPTYGSGRDVENVES